MPPKLSTGWTLEEARRSGSSCQRGASDAPEHSCSRGADVRKDRRGIPQLHVAAGHGRLDRLNLILDKLKTSAPTDHVDVDVPTNDGVTPFMYAAARGHVDIMEALWSNGAKASSGQTRRFQQSLRDGDLCILLLLVTA